MATAKATSTVLTHNLVLSLLSIREAPTCCRCLLFLLLVPMIAALRGIESGWDMCMDILSTLRTPSTTSCMISHRRMVCSWIQFLHYSPRWMSSHMMPPHLTLSFSSVIPHPLRHHLLHLYIMLHFLMDFIFMYLFHVLCITL